MMRSFVQHATQRNKNEACKQPFGNKASGPAQQALCHLVITLAPKARRNAANRGRCDSRWPWKARAMPRSGERKIEFAMIRAAYYTTYVPGTAQRNKNECKRLTTKTTGLLQIKHSSRSKRSGAYKVRGSVNRMRGDSRWPRWPRKFPSNA